MSAFSKFWALTTVDFAHGMTASETQYLEKTHSSCLSFLVLLKIGTKNLRIIPDGSF
jgi:hypothetical protein